MLALIVLLSFMLPSSTAATQYVLIDRVTALFETVTTPFTEVETAPSTVEVSASYFHSGSKAALCTVPSGSTGRAYLDATFTTYVPTMGVKFWIRAVNHEGGAPTDNLSLAKVQFLNPSTVTLVLVRNTYGYFNAYFSGGNATAATIFMNSTKWYEVNVYYTTDDDVARVYVTPDGGTSVLLSSRSFSPSFGGGVALQLGIFEVESYGTVAIDDFSLYASPMLNVSKPVVNPGDTITISGVQFKGATPLNITIRSPAGQLIYSNPTIPTQADGTFSQTVVLPSQMEVGLYYVVAKQPTYYTGELRFHLGIWGPSVATVNRTIPFNFTGYGVKPGTSVTINVDKVPPPSLHVLTGLYSAYPPDGRFSSSNIVLPASQPLSSYQARISAQGTIDYASYQFEDSLTFALGPAPLGVVVQTDATRYMRTQTARITAVARYRNGTTVPPDSTFLLGIKVGTQVVLVNALMTYATGFGMWIYEFRLPANSPIGLNEITLTVTDPSANYGVGRANFTVATAAIQAQFEYESIIQRSQTINISAILSYPNNAPVLQGTFNLIARIGTTSRLSTLRYYSAEDRWKGSVTIAASDPTGTWQLILSGLDLERNVLNVSVSFEVVSAVLELTNEVDLNITYMRTMSILFQVVARYPSDQRVTTGTANASITFLAGAQTYRSSLTFSPTAQAWRGYLKVPADAPEGMYSVLVRVSDPSGNKGNLTAMINVVKATLTVDISADRSEFQVGFDTVGFSGSVYYPDGEIVNLGSVSIEVAVGANRRIIDMERSAEGTWTATMQTGFFDSGGPYSITVRASDGLNNTGTTTFTLTGSQLYVILSLAGVALSLAIAIALIWRFRQSSSGISGVTGKEYEYYL